MALVTLNLRQAYYLYLCSIACCCSKGQEKEVRTVAADGPLIFYVVVHCRTELAKLCFAVVCPQGQIFLYQKYVALAYPGDSDEVQEIDQNTY